MKWNKTKKLHKRIKKTKPVNFVVIQNNLTKIHLTKIIALDKRTIKSLKKNNKQKKTSNETVVAVVVAVAVPETAATSKK